MCVLGTPFFVDQWWWSGGVIHPFYSPILLAPSGPIRTVQGKGRIFLVEERGEGGDEQPTSGGGERMRGSLCRSVADETPPQTPAPPLPPSCCGVAASTAGDGSSIFFGGINRWGKDRESVAWVFSFPRNSWLLFRRYRIATRRIVLISKHR